MKLFSIFTNFGRHEFSVVFMNEDIGFAGKVNDVTICTGDYEDVRNQILACFKFNQNIQKGFH